MLKQGMLVCTYHQTWFHMVIRYYLKVPWKERRTADKEVVVSMKIQLLQSFTP